MTTPNPVNPPQLPKALEETIRALKREFLLEDGNSNTHGAIHSSQEKGKETHMIDYYGFMEKGGFARVSITIILSDKMERLSLGS